MLRTSSRSAPGKLPEAKRLSQSIAQSQSEELTRFNALVAAMKP